MCARPVLASSASASVPARARVRFGLVLMVDLGFTLQGSGFRVLAALGAAWRDRREEGREEGVARAGDSAPGHGA